MVLNGGIAIMRLGTATDGDLQEKKRRVANARAVFGKGSARVAGRSCRERYRQ